MNSLFSYATIDSKSNILCQSNKFESVFLCKDHRLYSSPLLNPYEDILSDQDKRVINNNETTKSLLINISEQNFILTKFPAIVHNQTFGVYVSLEEFRINLLKNFINFDNTRFPSNIEPKYLNIANYSKLQREIIFCLLINKHSDKSIAQFIESRKHIIISTRSIKNAFHQLYNKLLTNDREHLTALCYQLNFDKYIPTTLYVPGVYNIADIEIFLGNSRNFIHH